VPISSEERGRAEGNSVMVRGGVDREKNGY